MPHSLFTPRVLAALLTVASLPTLALGQVPILEESAWLTGSLPNSGFGWRIAADGERLAISALYTDEGRGTIFVFEAGAGGWLETDRLVASDGAPSDQLGRSLAICGSTLVGGTPSRAPLSTGGVYTFEYSAAGWSEAGLIEGTGSFESFGVDVALDGDRMAVGADGEDEAFVYVKIGASWVLEAHLTGPFLSNFGQSLDLEGDTLVIGAPHLNSLDGAVYVFVREAGSWVQQAMLELGDAGSFTYFGLDVALSGDALVANSNENSGAQINAGASYVFERVGSTWSQAARFEALEPSAWGKFGWTVAIDGDDLVLGYRGDDTFGGNTGSLYWYQRSGGEWNHRAVLRASAENPSDGLGQTLALKNGIIFAAGVTPSPQGNVYVFEPSCGSVESYCLASLNSTGEAALAGALGNLSVAGNDLTLVASQCPPAQPALFIYGPQGNQTPFGDGYLCIQESPDVPIYVYPAGMSSLSGDVSRTFDFETFRPGGQIFPGSTWCFQLLYRDPAAGGGMFNLSNALRMTFCR